MLKVGITGLMGSGKTTVCHIFEVLGIPIFDADTEAKRLMNSRPDLKNQLINIFGTEAYNLDGTINRPYIAQRIFSDKELLTAINAAVHPLVLQELMSWFSSLKNDRPYALYESALIGEKHRSFLDLLILVSAPREVRIQRVKQRQNISRQAIIKRMASQPDEKDLHNMADYIIYNDGRPLIPQVLAIHQKIIAVSQTEF